MDLREEGREEGHDRVNALNAMLFEFGRIDDIVRTSKGKQYQKKLMDELLEE